MRLYKPEALVSVLMQQALYRLTFHHEFDSAGNVTDFVNRISLYSTKESKVPELVIIIQSPHEINSSSHERANVQIANGSPLVWLIYKSKALAEIYRDDGYVEILIAEEFLDGGIDFPALLISVDSLFLP